MCAADDAVRTHRDDELAVNQFTVTSGVASGINRRPDILVFVNGLPVGVIELKNATDEQATIWSAFNQLQTYKAQIPRFFAYNGELLISDEMEARISTMTADRERFMPWRTTEGQTLAAVTLTQWEVLIKGVIEKRRFFDLLWHFIVFEDEWAGSVVKKMAGYHQLHGVNEALAETVKASATCGDRRVGVVSHTQGSGMSLTMAFYAARDRGTGYGQPDDPWSDGPQRPRRPVVRHVLTLPRVARPTPRAGRRPTRPSGQSCGRGVRRRISKPPCGNW